MTVCYSTRVLLLLTMNCFIECIVDRCVVGDVDEVFIPPPPPKRATLLVPDNFGNELSVEDRYRIRHAALIPMATLLDTDGQLLTQSTLQLLAPDGTHAHSLRPYHSIPYMIVAH
jgi:hypothetical protein